VDFYLGNLVFNHTAADYVFGAKLVVLFPDFAREGDKNVFVYAGTTHLTADSSGFDGTTKILGGKLLVDGALGGAAAVNQGGTLGGSGRFAGTVTVNSGGTLAPGNSIGTFNVGGDLTFQPGSIYEVEVTPQGASDLVAVGGKAIINGGSVISVGQDSGFRPFTQYTILTAAGGVSGQFAGASNNYAFLNPSLAYEQNAVKLQLLRNDISFGSIGVTANQRAVAAGAESTGAGTPVWNAVAVLSAEQARAAFDALSGEVHASTQTALSEDAWSIQHAVLDGYAEREQRGDSRLWIKALGERARTDATSETARLESDRSGLLTGADLSVGDTWRLGALLGAGKTRNEVAAREALSKSDNVHVGVYAEANWENGWRLRLGGIRSNYDLVTHRQVSVAGLGDAFTATTDAHVTQFYGELDYAFAAGAVELEPFLGVSQMKLDSDGFRETGGIGALQGDAVDASTRYASLGMRLGYGFGEASRWRLGGSLAWRRATGDVEPAAKLRFDGGETFVVEGAPIERNTTLMTAGVTAQLSERTSLDLTYLGQMASEADDHGASARLTLRF
jgi:outer membrane autotransporter protein